MARRTLLFLCALLLGGAVALPQAQSLSSQVLQLLIRTNTWTGRQTFYDLRLPDATPADSSARLYQIGGVLYWNGGMVAGGGGGPALHALLSSTHSDTSAAAAARGAIITGQGASPLWTRLTIGSVGTVLRSDGTDVAWSTDGSGLTALNASQVTSGTLPLARLSGITNTEIAAGASIGWTKLDKAGSSLADLTTRSAGDLTSGSLADARLSANVSLFGASVDNAEVTDATLLFAKWASNGCSSGQYPQYNGSAWVCGTVTPGSGTVTSVGLTMPAIFSVTGSPVTGSGSLAASLATQTANLVWAGPSTGSPAAPTFRSLVYNDLPTSAAAAGTYPKVTINAQGIVTGTANQITLTTDVTGTLPLANGGTGLNAASDDSVLLSNGSAWEAKAIANCTTAITYTAATNTFGCSATVGTHALLSASHTDTLAATVVRGDLITGSAVPQWTRLAIGAVNSVLTSNGSDPVWDASPTLDALSVQMANGSLTVGTGGSPSKITVSSYIAPTGGLSASATTYLGSLQEYFSGTHAALYAHEFTGYFTGSAGATTLAANVYIGQLISSTATTTYSLLTDGPAQFTEGVYERNRTVKVGDSAVRTYAAGNYTAGGTMTWTVDSGDVFAESFSEVGTTQWFSFVLTTTTVGGTANPELRVTLPNSRTATRTTSGTCAGLDNSTNYNGIWQVTSGNTYVSLYSVPNTSTNWTLSTNATQVRCTVTAFF